MKEISRGVNKVKEIDSRVIRKLVAWIRK